MNNLKYKRIVYSGLRMLTRNKLRTFFMMLGIIIGITALTLTLTIGNGVEKKILANVARFVKPNNIMISSEKIQAEGLRESENGPNTTLKIQDIEALAHQIDGVYAYDYLFILPEKEVSRGSTNHFTTIKGCQPQGEQLWNKRIANGRFFDESELKNSSRVAILGPDVAEILFGDSDPIDQKFQLGDAQFTVIGISEVQGSDPHGSNLDDEIVIPITTLMRRVANVDYIMAAKLVFESEEESIASEEAVRSILREQHSLTEGEADDFTLMTPVQVKALVAEMVKVFKVLLPSISAIALLAGAIVIMVLMSMSVNQRIKEVGLRKALGAKNRDISMQFMAESVAVVLIGGLIGLIFGLLASKGLSGKLNADFYIPVQSIVVGISLSLITGFIAGIVPARKAARQNPVETLK